jgi:protein-tyrosine phosphatase
MLERLVDGGALTSVTAGSLDGRFGRSARAFALGLIRDGIVHNVASDAHDETRRPPSIALELGRSGLGGLVNWLTEGVPAAILGGDDLPPRPTVEERPHRTRRLRRP